MMPMQRKLAITITISLAFAAIFSAMAAAGVFGTAAVRFSDALYAGHLPLKDIAIIAVDDASLQEIGRWPWSRAVFAGALMRLEESSSIGLDISFFEPSSEDSALQDALSQLGRKVVLSSEVTEFDLAGGEISAKESLIPIFNASYGFTNVFQDADGVVRSLPPRIGGMEAFSAKIAEAWLGTDITVPQERMLINFAGPPRTFRTYSFADVYDGTIPSEEFKDKIVIIGATARDLRDEQVVPITHGPMAGVEIHANAVQTIIAQSYLRYQDALSAALTIFLLCILGGLALYRLKLAVAAIILFVLLISLFFAASFAFDGGTIVNIFHTALALIATYIANVGFFYITESRRRREVTDLFGKYVSSDVVTELLKNPEQIKLGGKRKDITIMFSDIRGFTALSEKLKPEELVRFMNEYLTAMSDIVMKNRGIVDKYIGDAIMAFWGAPLDDPAHAEKALATAVEMIAELRKFKAKWKNEGLDVNIGIGINSGDAVVGNMGSLQRFSYTAMGDTVNTASRLEGLNKEYGTSIIASEGSYRQAIEKFFARELDLVKVKGRQTPVRIFEVMAKAGEETEKQKKIRSHFESALELYRKKKWLAAAREFAKPAKLGDKASEIFIARCKLLEKQKLPKDWDGAFEAKTK